MRKMFESNPISDSNGLTLKKGGEEKYGIYQTWYNAEKPKSERLFVLDRPKYTITEELKGFLRSCTEDCMYLYIMEVEAGGMRLPLYIGKSRNPASRWGDHFRKLNGVNKGSYASWRKVFETLDNPIYLSVLSENTIQSAPLSGFPCTVGSVEYQLISLAGDFSPLLLNHEGNAR
jgi:GIY-YIG catalytic domain-containing protein